MVDPLDLLRRVVAADARVRNLEEELSAARIDLGQAVLSAIDGGVPQSLIARQLGLSRQRIFDIAERARRS